MPFVSGLYSLPAGYDIPIVANSALGMRWSYDTMFDIEQSIKQLTESSGDVINVVSYSFTLQPNSILEVLGGNYTVPAGVDVTVPASSNLRVADWAPGLYSGLVRMTLNDTTIPLGYIMDMRSFGSIPVTIPAGAILTIPAGSALIA